MIVVMLFSSYRDDVADVTMCIFQMLPDSPAAQNMLTAFLRYLGHIETNTPEDQKFQNFRNNTEDLDKYWIDSEQCSRQIRKNTPEKSGSRM